MGPSNDSVQFQPGEAVVFTDPMHKAAIQPLHNLPSQLQSQPLWAEHPEPVELRVMVIF